MNLTDISFWSLALLLPLLGAALGLFWLIDRKMLRRMLRVMGIALGQMVLAGAYVWLLYKADRWWVDALWLVVMAAATAFFSVRRARLAWQQCLWPAAAGVALAAVIVSSVLLLSFSSRLFVPIAAIVMGHTMASQAKCLQTFTSSLRHTDSHRRYLLANGASVLEALMPSIRRAMRASLLPMLKRLDSPLAVVLPLLFCGMLMGGASAAAALVATLLLWAAAIVACVMACVATLWLYARYAAHISAQRSPSTPAETMPPA